MTALTLAMKSIFQVQLAGTGLNLVTILTLLYRLALAPGVAAVDVVMMAGSAGQTGGLVGLVPENHRAFGSWLKFLALQGTDRFWFRGAQGFGAQQNYDC